MMDSYKEELKL